MLTPRQRDLLKYINKYMRLHGGVCPSFEEMQNGIGLASKSGVHRMILGLEERGFIRRIKDRKRAIEVIRAPQ